ncbi:MAG: DUF4388 domain-containing protein [Rhodospirillales bacterium]|nr:DUF4388 domain-containing protein [Rhodospirillales bacterium]
MTISGSLSDVALPNIVQLVSESGKTGAFVLQSGIQVGKIFLSEGTIVHAQLGSSIGEEAVCEIAVWQDANFVFMENQTTAERSIQRSTTGLLMEAARRVDEWQVLSKHFPSTDLIPRLSDQGWTTSVSFSPQEWSIICKLDTRRSIDELAKSLKSTPFEVCKILYGLVIKGLVELEPAGP